MFSCLAVGRAGSQAVMLDIEVRSLKIPSLPLSVVENNILYKEIL